MKAAEMQAAGVNLSLVAWLARHTADVPAIVAGVQAVVAAQTLAARWSAIKSVGDLIVSDLADFPTPSHPAPVNPPAPTPNDPVIGPVQASIKEVDGVLSAIGDGHILNAIVALLTNPQTLAVIELILKLAGIAI